MLRVIHVPPLRDVVHAPDQKIPVHQPRQLFDPPLVPLKKIALQSQPHRDLRPLSGPTHRFRVPGQILQPHPPIVEIHRLRVVVRKPDLPQPRRRSRRHVLLRLSRGVLAKRRVNMEIGAHLVGLVSATVSAQPPVRAMKFIRTVYEKLQRHPKRIVFPEGTEPRVLEAAARFQAMGLGAPVLLGSREDIEPLAVAQNLDLERIGIIDPTHADDLPIFIERLEKLKRYRNLGKAETHQLASNPNYFAALMIQYGQADGLVGGTANFAGTLLRPLIQVVKPLPGATNVSSCQIFDLEKSEFGEGGLMVMADCGVIPDPTVEQLAFIALETGKAFRQLTGIKPRIAMLSFSTKGSSRLVQAEKMAAAAALAKHKAEALDLNMEIDGELQADAAISPEIGPKKAPSSQVAGRANVLVFPDLNSGNIASKLVHYLAGGNSYGQLLLGLSKPAADLSRGASADEILGMAAIVGLQAIEYRKLYPETDPDAA